MTGSSQVQIQLALGELSMIVWNARAIARLLTRRPKKMMCIGFYVCLSNNQHLMFHERIYLVDADWESSAKGVTLNKSGKSDWSPLGLPSRLDSS